MSAEDLEAFVRSQPAATLADILLDLAGDHEAVRERLLRWQLADRPEQLAAGFKKALDGWRKSRKFHDYRESREFGRMLEGWIDQVARELLPKDPLAAAKLLEAFINADASWIERADDSDGCIGDAVRAACRHWLAAAAQTPSSRDQWSDRLLRLVNADEYGGREELLRCANLLLDEEGLRRLVAGFEAQLEALLANRADQERLPHEVYKASAALSLLSEALRDPDVKVRAVLRYSPLPNALQKEEFVRAFLDANRPADALPWLEGTWDHHEYSQQGLLAEVLGRLGRHEESAQIRQAMFEKSLSVFALHGWLEQLPQSARPEAREHVRQLALNHPDAVAACSLLIEVGDLDAAEMRLVSSAGSLPGDNYPALVPLAEAMKAHGRQRAETVVYRALLIGILDRAYARAYSHAARYLWRLQEIAGTGVDLSPLQSHADFETAIRARHGRKPAFWAHVNGKH